MSQAQAYKNAIEIIAGDHDWKALCIRIAQDTPSILCAAAGIANVFKPRHELTLIEQQALALLEEQGIVHAIKYYRQEKGCGLKESKDYIELLAEKYNVSRRSY